MPLLRGPQNMRKNYNELTQNPVQSSGREKAIQTIASSRRISYDEAKHVQALAIVKSQARKR